MIMGRNRNAWRDGFCKSPNWCKFFWRSRFWRSNSAYWLGYRNYGILDVRGGDASGADPREPGNRFNKHSGGAGGGGRVALLTRSNGTIVPGSVQLDGGSGNFDGSSGLPGTFYHGLTDAHSLQSLSIDSGTIEFDTAGMWKHSSGLQGGGNINQANLIVDGNFYSYSLCEFRFSEVSIGKNASVIIKGSNALNRRDGNASISSSFNLNGKTGQSGIYSGMGGPAVGTLEGC